MMEVLLVAMGGAVGAVARYFVGVLTASVDFPFGTLVVNTLGSFLLGCVLFGTSSTDLALLLGVGFAGAFTTFSSFSVQGVDLWRTGRPVHAIGHAVGNLVAAFLAFGLAWLVVT